MTKTIKVSLCLGGVILLAIIYFCFDPASTPWMPRCILHTLTGLDCPGCGAQRMAFALLHGRLSEAFAANPFLLCSLPLLLLYIIVSLWPQRLPRLYHFLMHPYTISTYLILLLLWGVIRNLPPVMNYEL